MISMSWASTALRAGLLLTLLASVALFGTGHATGAELTVSWTDNSNGTTRTWIERWSENDNLLQGIVDVPPGVTVVGMPARNIGARRRNPQSGGSPAGDDA